MVRRRLTWVRIIPGCQSDNEIDEDAQGPLEVIRLSVTQEIAHDENGQYQAGNHEDLKVQVHRLVESPADNHDKGGVEKGGLDRRANAVEESKVLGRG